MRLIRFLVVLATLMLVTPSAPVGAATVDGLFNEIGVLSGGSTINLTIGGRGGVPGSGVGSVALNVTAVGASGGGYLTVWPTGQGQPNASNLNVVAGQTIPNMVIVPLGANGQVSIFSSVTVDLLVDVLGWFAAGSSFNGLNPARLIDTRGGATVDGANSGNPKLVGNSPINLTVSSRGGVPGSGVGSVALNVTAVDAFGGGYLTVWPTGQGQPNASNLNVVTGQTVPNMVIVPLGANGQVSIFSSVTVGLLVDVLGWFPDDSSFNGLNPARLIDTRGGATVDGANSGNPKVIGNAPINLTVGGRGGVPGAGVGSVALNVTAVGASGGGYLTVWPTGQGQPNASNLNVVAGQTIPNMVIVPLGANGQVSIFSSVDEDLLVDVLGWFPAGSSFNGLNPARLMDTRIPPPPPPPTPPTVLTFNAGTHLVNSTIPPGRYVSENARSGCYWERLSGLGGTLDEIIANDFRGFAGRVIVDVFSSDVAFAFDADCAPFKTFVAPAGSPSSVIVPGSHAVGLHIQSGTYTTQAAAGCYWERTSSFDGTIDSVIANVFVGSAGPQYVTVSPTDVGFFSDPDCGTWQRI